MADATLPEGDHEVVNLVKGMDALRDSERILMVTGDMPLLIPHLVQGIEYAWRNAALEWL